MIPRSSNPFVSLLKLTQPVSRQDIRDGYGEIEINSEETTQALINEFNGVFEDAYEIVDPRPKKRRKVNSTPEQSGAYFSSRESGGFFSFRFRYSRTRNEIVLDMDGAENYNFYEPSSSTFLVCSVFLLRGSSLKMFIISSKEPDYEDTKADAIIRRARAREVAVDFAWLEKESKTVYSVCMPSFADQDLIMLYFQAFPTVKQKLFEGTLTSMKTPSTPLNMMIARNSQLGSLRWSSSSF